MKVAAVVLAIAAVTEASFRSGDVEEAFEDMQQLGNTLEKLRGGDASGMDDILGEVEKIGKDFDMLGEIGGTEDLSGLFDGLNQLEKDIQGTGGDMGKLLEGMDGLIGDLTDMHGNLAGLTGDLGGVNSGNVGG